MPAPLRGSLSRLVPKRQAPRFCQRGCAGYHSRVSHLFTPAASGRSKCRGCSQAIKRGELRFGECLPNLFGDGDMTLWFHPLCAAYKRPQPLLEALATNPEIPGREMLEVAAQRSAASKRLPRIDGAERAPSGQATCRCCRELIARGTWRIRIVFYEEGRFSPGGYVHLACRKAYFETEDVFDQLLHFSAGLTEAERQELQQAFKTSAA